MPILKTALEKLFSLREKSQKRTGEKGPDGAPIYEDAHEKPFLDHLEDLRHMFVRMIATQLVTTIGCFIWHKRLFDFMYAPLKLPWARFDVEGEQIQLFDAVEFMGLAPQEPFMLSLKVSFLAGLIIALPLHTFFIAQFVLPGLTDREKKYVIPGIGVAFILFLIGASFAFFGALPFGLKFLHQYGANMNISGQWRIGYYIGFVTQVVIIFGLCFELPVVTTLLVKLQLITYRTMASSRSFAIVLLCVLSAVLTPPDPFTMVMLALPMIFLYEICVWIAFFIDRKREAREAEEEAEYRKWVAEQNEKGLDEYGNPLKPEDDDKPRALTSGDDDDFDHHEDHDDDHDHDPDYDYDADHADYQDDAEDSANAGTDPVDDIDRDPAYDESNIEKYGDPYGALEDIPCPEDRRNVARTRKARELAKNAELLANLLVDINNCGIDELTSLPGIGPKLAQEIINHRPFGTPDQILTIPGISEEKFQAIAARLFAG